MDGDHDQNHEIALLAHDLRTPLSAMKLTAELIGAEKLSPIQVERLNLLIRSIDALSDMTGALLHTSETGGRMPELSEIAADTAELFRAPAEAKGLGYKAEIEASKIRLEPVRAGALRRVMTTLLDNAVKYTDTGKVSISFDILLGEDEALAEIRLAVADTGPGIDPMERRHLFKPYVRGAAGKARSPGSGLGLWGASQLVADLGGKLRLISPKAGGCRFEMNLPLAPETTESVVRADPADVSDAEAHVLIVDDNETNRRLLSALLESFGISCDQVPSGTDALKIILETDYDAVLLDLHMPVMDGLETASRIRELHTTEGLPLIAVTAAMESIGDKRMRQAGFVEVLAKPLSPSLLFQAMEHARRHHAARLNVSET